MRSVPPYTNLQKAILVACALVLPNGCSSERKPAAAPPTPVVVTTVEQYAGNEGVNYSASIVPYEQISVSFKSAGYVTSILQRKGADGRARNLQQGDFVKKGSVLATVRQSDYRHAVEQYQGQLVQAQAGALKSQQDFARAQALFNANALTQPDYDAAKAQLDSSEGSVNTVKALLAQAQQSLVDCELRAPSDGQILSRNIEVGALVATGTPAFTMGETSVVKAVFGIPDTVLPSISLAQKQSVQTEIYPQSFAGRVTAISPQADQKSRTFQVEVTVPNTKQLLKSGMVATLNLGQAKLPTPLLVVPLSAIISVGDGSKNFSVFVVQREAEKDIARRRSVQPGAAFGNMVSITKGVSLGERVVSNGATLLTEGQVVHLIP
jgi:multidrug efflux system membrane fusion protein